MYICLFSEGDSSSEDIGNRFSRENICSAIMLASATLGVRRKKNFILVVHGPQIHKLTIGKTGKLHPSPIAAACGLALATPGTEHPVRGHFPGIHSGDRGHSVHLETGS